MDDKTVECQRCVCTSTPGTARLRENGQTLCDACEEDRRVANEMRAAQANPMSGRDLIAIADRLPPIKAEALDAIVGELQAGTEAKPESEESDG